MNKLIAFIFGLLAINAVAQSFYKYNTVSIQRESSVYAKQTGVGVAGSYFNSTSNITSSSAYSPTTIDNSISHKNTITSYTYTNNPLGRVYSNGSGLSTAYSKSGLSISDGAFSAGLVSITDMGITDANNIAKYNIASSTNTGLQIIFDGNSNATISIARLPNSLSFNTTKQSTVFLGIAPIILDGIKLEESLGSGSFGITTKIQGDANDQ